MWHDRCTKCDHKEPFHRQRDIRMWALDECNLSGCFCIKYSSNKKFIGKFSDQGTPKNVSEELQERFVWDTQKRKEIEEIAISLILKSRKTVEVIGKT